MKTVQQRRQTIGTRPTRKPPATASRRGSKGGSDRTRKRFYVPGLRNARLAQDISQERLSRMSGVTRAAISHAEWGDSRANSRTIERLSQALGIPARDILPGGRYDDWRREAQMGGGDG